MTDNEKNHDKHKYEGQMKGLHRDADKKVEPGIASDQPKEMPMNSKKDEKPAAGKTSTEAMIGSSASKTTPSSSSLATAKSSVPGSGASSASRPAAKPATTASKQPVRSASYPTGPRKQGWMGRVLGGYALATLAGAATLAAYFLPNADLAGAKPQEAGDWIEHFVTFSGLTWPFIALFAAPFALIGLGVAESRRIRDWTYYAMLAIGISLIGFLAKYGVEPDGAARTLFNNFAVTAFLTAGLIAGFVYWLIAGRRAH